MIKAGGAGEGGGGGAGEGGGARGCGGAVQVDPGLEAVDPKLAFKV